MYLETAIGAAKLGGKIIMQSLSNNERKQISRKQQFDFVTQVDHDSEETKEWCIDDEEIETKESETSCSCWNEWWGVDQKKKEIEWTSESEYDFG